jgi:hypothetical protein
MDIFTVLLHATSEKDMLIYSCVSNVVDQVIESHIYEIVITRVAD